jgi:hypothetical protein
MSTYLISKTTRRDCTTKCEANLVLVHISPKKSYFAWESNRLIDLLKHSLECKTLNIRIRRDLRLLFDTAFYITIKSFNEM